MDQAELERKYSEALGLHQNGMHVEALALFDELNEASPFNKDVMYGRAVCLVMLGRYDEARPVCEQLATVYGDVRAQQLLQSAGQEQALGVTAETAAPKAEGGLWRTLIAVAVAIPLAYFFIREVVPLVQEMLNPPVEQKAVEPSIKQFPTNLRVLALDSNPIDDEALANIQSLDGIEVLSLEYAPVSDNAIAYLRNMRSLKELRLKGSRVTDEGVRALTQALPAVKVIRD